MMPRIMTVIQLWFGGFLAVAFSPLVTQALVDRGDAGLRRGGGGTVREDATRDGLGQPPLYRGGLWRADTLENGECFPPQADGQTRIPRGRLAFGKPGEGLPLF